MYSDGNSFEQILDRTLNNELLTFEVINNKIEMPNTSKSININYLSGIIIILINISIGLYEKKYKDN